jgi:hypothetical protein
MSFEPERVFEALEREGVRYVVIGGVGAVLHGSPMITSDTDICPARDPDNLQRLARALESLGARIRTDSVPEGRPFACDAAFFEQVDLVNLVTRYGPIDVAFEPAGTGGFPDLATRARRFELSAGLAPSVASLEDIIRSKEAANRPKDIAALPILKMLLEEIRRREAK